MFLTLMLAAMLALPQGGAADTKHTRGILSMARGDDPASASTSFFSMTAEASSLDGKYTVFARVVEGLEVVEKIEQAPVNRDAPVERIDIRTVRLIKP